MSNAIFVEETPAEVKNSKGLHLLTMSTPNGLKLQIMLEELAEFYGTEFTFTLVNIFTGIQKKDWFLRLNPNGRIPVLVDNTKTPSFSVMESTAELLYLLNFDKDNKFSFKDENEVEQSQCIQWLTFWSGNGAPAMGQTNYYHRFINEKVPHGMKQSRSQALEAFEVLETRLSGRYSDGPREYLAGSSKGQYTIADISAYSWVRGWKFSGFTATEMKSFPNLLEWISRISKRSAVQIAIGEKYAIKGSNLPFAFPF